MLTNPISALTQAQSVVLLHRLVQRSCPRIVALS